MESRTDHLYPASQRHVPGTGDVVCSKSLVFWEDKQQEELGVGDRNVCRGSVTNMSMKISGRQQVRNSVPHFIWQTRNAGNETSGGSRVTRGVFITFS